MQNDDEKIPRAKGDRLASGSIFTFVSIIVARIAIVLNAIIIIRILGPYDYGVLSIIILIISIATVFANLQIPSALVKFLAATPTDRPREVAHFLGGGFLVTLISTIVSIVVLVILAPIFAFSLYLDPRMNWLLLIAIIGLVITSISSPFFSVFQAFERIKEIGIRNTVVAILTVPSTLVLVWFYALPGAVLAGVVNSIISVIVNISLLRRIVRSRKLRVEIPRDRVIYHKMLGFGLPALGGTVLVTITLWFSSTLLVLYASFSNVGLYTAGYGLSSYILFIPAAIGMPLVPIISKLDRDSPGDLPHFIVRTMRVGAFLTLIPTLVLIAMPEPFLRILYGQAYVSAASVVRLVLPAKFLACISSLVGYGMHGTGQMKSAFMANIIWAVPMVITSIAWIPLWEENGVALAILCSYIIHFIATIAIARYLWAVNIRKLSPIMLIAILALPTAILISFGAGIPRFLLTLLLTSGVIIAGLQMLSKRENDVLFQPLKKITSRIRRQKNV